MGLASSIFILLSITVFIVRVALMALQQSRPFLDKCRFKRFLQVGDGYRDCESPVTSQKLNQNAALAKV